MAFKSTDGKAVSKYLVTLDEDTVARARDAGGGNLSLGIRNLIGSGTAPALPSEGRTTPRRSLGVKTQRTVRVVSAEEQCETELRALRVVYRDGDFYNIDGGRLSPARVVQLRLRDIVKKHGLE